MADVKISALTALTTPATDDVFPIVDTDTTTTKKITYANIESNLTLTNLGGTLSVAKGGTGATSITANSYIKGNGTSAIAERTYAEVKTDLSLNNVENTAISTWVGSSNITTVGTLSAGNVDAAVTDAAADGATKGKATFTATDFSASSGVISIDYTNAQKASTTQAGFLTEIATAAETTTGTDATRVISPDGLAGSVYGQEVIQLKIFDDATAVSTGDGKLHFFIPTKLNGWNLVEAAAGVSTVSSSGLPTVAIYNVTDSQDMLSTNITIDANEKTSYTAVTSAVINTTYDDVATGDELRIDVDVAGTGTKGLTVFLTFQLP